MKHIYITDRNDLKDEHINKRKKVEKNLTVFSYYNWKKSFIDAYKEHEYFVVCLEDEHGVFCILPIQKRLNIIEFIWTPRCDYQEPIFFRRKDIDILSIVDFLKKHFVGCKISLMDYIYSYNLNIDWEMVAMIDLNENNTSELDFTKYCNKKFNILKRDWIIYKYCSLISKEDKKLALRDLFYLHRIRRANFSSSNQFDDKRNIDLYNYLIENLFDKNTQVNILYFDWEISAIHFWFLDSDRSYYYKPTYNPKFNKYSPWMLLLHFMINEAKDEKRKYFDFLRWNESYKLKFINNIFYNANIKDDNWN